MVKSVIINVTLVMYSLTVFLTEAFLNQVKNIFNTTIHTAKTLTF